MSIEFIRQTLFTVEKNNEQLRNEVTELLEHIDHLQLIIKVQRTKLYEKEHYGKNL